MQSDGEKATTESVGDFTIRHIICRNAVSVEFLSQLFFASGIDTHGMQSGSFISDLVGLPRYLKSTDGSAG